MENEVANNVSTILQHRIEWWLRGENAPDELDECSVEHIEQSIKEGYIQGELGVSVYDADADVPKEFRGWWKINNCPQA